MGFLSGIINIATKVLPSVGEGIIAGVKHFASNMDDSLLSSSTSDMSGAVRTYRNQYSFWSSQKPMGPSARFDKRLFEMTKVGGKYGVKPMGYFVDPVSGLLSHTGFHPLNPTIMSRGQNSLFFPERRITNC